MAGLGVVLGPRQEVTMGEAPAPLEGLRHHISCALIFYPHWWVNYLGACPVCPSGSRQKRSLVSEGPAIHVFYLRFLAKCHTA